MPVTKKELNRALVEERKKMREKAKQSLFMRRTLAIFNAMKARAVELGRLAEIDFTLDQFRDKVAVWLLGNCLGCGIRHTVKKLSIDHATPIARGGSFSFANLGPLCQSCNWQKGKLTTGEFELLLAVINRFPPDASADVKRRLTIGGRWSWK